MILGYHVFDVLSSKSLSKELDLTFCILKTMRLFLWKYNSYTLAETQQATMMDHFLQSGLSIYFDAFKLSVQL